MVNWLERLDANIEVYLFNVADKLLTNEDDRRENMESLSKNISSI